MKSYIHLYKTNQEFTEAYNSPNYEEPWLSLTEENNAINYSKMLTAITFENLTWKTDVPSTGGTATKDNCTYTIMAKYIGSEPEDITSQVADNVTGELVVVPSTIGQRHEAGTLTLTAEYKGITCTGSVAVYQEAVDFTKEPLTFKITSGGTIYWSTSNRSVSKTIDYKLNDGEWKSITSNTWTSAPKINVNAGDKVQFKGNNTAYGAHSSRDALYNTFYGSTARFEIEGNIMSLINSENFATLITLESDYTFSYLFDDCTGLTSAENLILPATTLTNQCYYYMFQSCRSLTTAPKLPAKTLGYLCYGGMFRACTRLTAAPELPATTLAISCYSGMFNGCTSLTAAPELPATKLAQYCYVGMFEDCTSLTTAPELPAAILEYGCYQSMFKNCRSLNYIKCLAEDISASECTTEWVNGVAATGTFKKAASMTNWSRDSNGIPINWTAIDAS